MTEILIRAVSFVAITVTGYVPRRGGFFKEEDFYVLSEVILRIMLPAVIIPNFSGIDMKPSMLLLSLPGLGGGVIFVTMAFPINIGKSREERASHIINMLGYNIGNFTLPFVQGFLRLLGVVAANLFDSGNALACLGGSYSIASMVKGGKSGFSIRPVVESLLTSAPFDAYLLMTILSLLHLSLPSPMVPFTGIIASANAFMAMLMLGAGFKMAGDRSQLGRITKISGIWYSIPIALASVSYFLLSFALEYRRALTILALSPITSSSPAYTAELKGDAGLSSVVSSLSIIISVASITGTLPVIL